MNKLKSPCLGCHECNGSCHGTYGPYKWYQTEQELYKEFMGSQKKTGEWIDYPDSQLKRMGRER